jgi:regulatory protein
MKQLTEAEALHQAAAYCSMSERCIQEVIKKITCDTISLEAQQRIIDYLLKENFINETRYVQSFVNDKLRFNKWGRIKIGYELNRKGIDSETRKDALDNIKSAQYTEILFNLLKSKKRTIKSKDDRDLYTKLLRFAAGRGFTFNEANDCLKKILNETDFETEDYSDME